MPVRIYVCTYMSVMYVDKHVNNLTRVLVSSKISECLNTYRLFGLSVVFAQFVIVEGFCYMLYCYPLVHHKKCTPFSIKKQSKYFQLTLAPLKVHPYTAVVGRVDESQKIHICEYLCAEEPFSVDIICC